MSRPPHDTRSASAAGDSASRRPPCDERAGADVDQSADGVLQSVEGARVVLRRYILGAQGIILVLMVFLYPLIFPPLTDALDNMDSRLEEAAESAGAGRWHTLRAVTLPLMLPPMFSGSLLVFISAFGPSPGPSSASPW